MANPKAVITQKDATRLMKAAISAGFNTAKIIVHPDGRIEAVAAFSDVVPTSSAGEENSWDAPLRAKGL